MLSLTFSRMKNNHRLRKYPYFFFTVFLDRNTKNKYSRFSHSFIATVNEINELSVLGDNKVKRHQHSSQCQTGDTQTTETTIRVNRSWCCSLFKKLVFFLFLLFYFNYFNSFLNHPFFFSGLLLLCFLKDSRFLRSNRSLNEASKSRQFFLIHCCLRLS